MEFFTWVERDLRLGSASRPTTTHQGSPEDDWVCGQPSAAPPHAHEVQDPEAPFWETLNMILPSQLHSVAVVLARL